MTLQEILKAKGLTDEQITAIMGEMKANKIFTAGEENLDIRYSKLKTDHENLTAQHGESTKLIEQLKAGTKDSEALQGKITTYEATIAELTKQLDEAKVEAAMDRQLTAAGAKATDLDYLKFQWRKKGEISLDDKGEIKGADDTIAGMKTQFPVQFESASGQRGVKPQPLPERGKDNGADTVTKDDFKKMGYNSRVKLKEENPELYETLKG